VGLVKNVDPNVVRIIIYEIHNLERIAEIECPRSDDKHETEDRERERGYDRKSNLSVGHDFTDHPVYALTRLERWVELSYLRVRAPRARSDI
jgi:hypothetical protein